MKQRRACVCRCMPFVLIIKDVDARDCREIPACRIRIDPGSKYTGIAIADNSTNDFVLGFIIEHRGEQIHKNLDRRRGAGRNRRNRETLYRHSKFVKGKAPTSRKKGWLPPSEMSLVGSIDTWVKRLCRWLPVTSAAMEAVRFDTQLLDDPDIEAEQYQHGTLYGYEIKEYLLDKYQHTCQYCGGKSEDQVLEWEHMVPGSRHGSDSIKNATLACHTCNQEKGNMTPQEWLEKIRAKKHPTELDKARIEGIQNVIDHKRTGGSNRYCAWVSATRKKDEWILFSRFSDIVCSTGGRTKYNRAVFHILKDHQYDAYCVGDMKSVGKDLTHGYHVYITAMGRGTHFRGKLNKYGFIVQKLKPRAKRIYGFMNGDIVTADVPKISKQGKPYEYSGHYVGRVMTRDSGIFDIRTTDGKLVTVNHEYVRLRQYSDGYQYSQKQTTEMNCQNAS